MGEVLDIRQFIPDKIVSGKNGNLYPLYIEEQDGGYKVFYWSSVSNQTGGNVGKRKHECTLPKHIILSRGTFEVLGLLQGEMSKTKNRGLTFANSRPELINAVLKFFEEQMKISPDCWKWYLKVNLRPMEEWDARFLEQQLVHYWLTACPISYGARFPTTLSFVRNTKNEFLKNQGTLMIERKSPIFVQTVQKLVNDMTYLMPDKPKDAIIAYMRGIIASEATVNFKKASGHRRVFITACKDSEREIFIQCLHKIGIETRDCKPIKDIVISRKENIEKLHRLGLMSLNLEKHEKFLWTVKSYIGGL